MPTNPIYKSTDGERIVMELYSAMLKRWPAPHEELNISTEIGNTFIIASGPAAAPPLVLLHGASSNALSWMGDVPQYCRSFRVYVPDIPGDPGRSASSRPDWNGPAYAEWLEDVLNGLKVPRTILIGLSQGGWTALKYAVYHPEKVEKLVLLTPAGVATDRISFLLKAIIFSLAGKRGAESINRLTFGKDPIHPDAVKVMNIIMTHFKPRISRLRLFTDEELRKLTMPVFLLGGQQDAIRDIRKIEARLRRLLPDLTTKIYPEKGHVLVNLSGDIISLLTSDRSK